jgi:hypothetical protein
MGFFEKQRATHKVNRVVKKEGSPLRYAKQVEAEYKRKEAERKAREREIALIELRAKTKVTTENRSVCL